MKIEQQVVSLEIAKRLKEFGVLQKGALFYWMDYSDEKGKDAVLCDRSFEKLKDSFAALTVSELGEIIKKGQTNKQMQFHADVAARGGYIFDAEYWGVHLIYLLENKLITL